jgi:hypothetical protein
MIAVAHPDVLVRRCAFKQNARLGADLRPAVFALIRRLDNAVK